MARFLRGLVPAILCALILSAVPGGALAHQIPQTIVPGRGIGGVAVGMTMAQVRARLGAPRTVARETIECCPAGAKATRLRYPTLEVTIIFDQVVVIRTTSSRYRTRGGVGVGSTWRDVRKIPGIRCEGTARSGSCFLGRFVPGAIVTDFAVRRGVVIRVTVGRVLD